MKINRKGRPSAWLAAALIAAALSGGYAFVSYQSCQAWQGLRGPLQAHADKNLTPSSSFKEPPVVDTNQTISDLVDRHGLTLLSWHQARQGEGQTVIVEGKFAPILSFLNDWQQRAPDGSCKVIEWVPSGDNTVLTVEVCGSRKLPLADKKGR